MQTFKIRQDGFKEIKKKMLIRTIPIMLIAVTVGIVISSINSKAKAEDVNVLPIIIPLVAASVGFGLYRGVNRQKSILESYTLTITNNLITREQVNTPTISIYFNDIKEIIKNKKGGFTIKGKEPADLIWVPIQIDNHSQLEKTLQEIRPLTVTAKVSLLQKYPALTALATIGLMLCVYTGKNKIVVGLTGIVLVTLLIWSFIKIRTSKNVDEKTRRGAWWLLLVLASVIGTIILKLTGLSEH